MAHNKKSRQRRQAPGSPSSSIPSSTPAQSTRHPRRRIVNVIDDSNVEEPNNQESTQTPRSQELTDEQELYDPEDRDDQIQLMVKDTGNTEDKEEAEETDLLAAKVIKNEEIKLKSNDVNELSDKDDDDRYKSDACKQTLAREVNLRQGL
ncbi:hypothetical protein PCANC_07434 [Puccinia coronata f. sp. avenae]|uniref:Uncharacterized protein n=1 Tax=Puccinia coronata f. sp. avenae TaxID=200324 RepID=A0A2N5T442_9BASI|nr:hypothetical protein PCANC_07434 [Puccinia coronata f. sp. avenae]